MANITPYADIENLAKFLDDQYEIAGFRFGISFLIDLVPGIGDIAATGLALYIFGLTGKYKLSNWIRFRMLLNIGFYFLIGLIPLIGDIIATWWKPNKRNVKLLQKYLAK